MCYCHDKDETVQLLKTLIWDKWLTILWIEEILYYPKIILKFYIY